MGLVSFFIRIGLASSALFLVACGGATPANDSSNVSAKPESSYCSTTYPTPTPHTITGTAQYQYRATTCGVSSCSGLAAGTSTRGIPHAELIVKNSAGVVVQCGHTNEDGTFSIIIDKVPGSYTVTVNSRADNSEIKVSVLDDITNNNPYSVVSNSFSVNAGTPSPQAVGTFTANLATSEQKGAAYHILYNLWTANEFLRGNSGNATFVADKVSAYWKAGFNPGSYVGVSSGLSFYIKGSRQLFILGGLNGNYSTTDFDHFDDSVILHEYGHFLEDVYSKSDSQGGSHNGNFIIDARLAWSEGFANFFQGAVIRQLPNVPVGSNNNVRGRFYIDITNGSNMGLVFDLTDDGQNTLTDDVSMPGEGVFREISVSRTLWKTTAPNGAPTTPAAGEVPFSAVWTAFTDTTNGIRNALDYFRNSGLFNYYLHQIITSNHMGRLSAWQNILDNEMQNRDTRDYADPVTAVTNNTCAQFPIALDPVIDSTYSYARSNLLRSNDFYKFTYTGGFSQLEITYTQADATIIDLDLYLYRDGYNYQDDYLESIGQATGGVISKSDRANPAIENGTETINLSGLAAGVYLINVKANTFNKTNAQLGIGPGAGVASYRLKLIGSQTWDLCPEN